MDLPHIRLALVGSQERRVVTNGVNTHTRLLRQALPREGVDIALDLFPDATRLGRAHLLRVKVLGRTWDRTLDARVVRDLRERHALLTARARSLHARIAALDVVHAQDYIAAAALAQALGEDLPPLVLAYHVNGTPADELSLRFGLDATSAAARWVAEHSRAAYAAARVLVAVSPWARDALLAQTPAVSPDRIEVIPNGVATPDPSTLVPLNARPHHVLAVGQLVPRKGHDVLLQAVARLRSEGTWPDEAVLQVAGSGPLLTSLTAEAARLHLPVRFLGAVREVGPLLDAARLFVLPSRRDNLPMALLEAMAHGLPVVASRVGGIADVVGEGPDAAGALVPPDDVASLASALAAYLHDRDLAARAGLAARRRVEASFSATAMARRYASLYRAVARTPSLSPVP